MSDSLPQGTAAHAVPEVERQDSPNDGHGPRPALHPAPMASQSQMAANVKVLEQATISSSTDPMSHSLKDHISAVVTSDVAFIDSSGLERRLQQLTVCVVRDKDTAKENIYAYIAEWAAKEDRNARVVRSRMASPMRSRTPRADKAAADKAAADKAAADKATADKAATDKAAEAPAVEKPVENKAAADKAAPDKAVDDKAAADKADADKAAADKPTADKAAADKAAADKAAADKAPTDKAAADKAAAEAIAKKTAEAEAMTISRQRREELRQYRAGSATFNKEETLEVYRARIADAIAIIRRQLTSPPSAEDVVSRSALPTDAPSRDPHHPLFGDLDKAYAVPIVSWLHSLPALATALLSLPHALRYTPALIQSLVGDCADVLDNLEKELRGPKNTGGPIRYTDTTRRHLDEAIKELRKLRVDPLVVAEECVAVALYTLELLTDKKVHPPELHVEKGVVVNDKTVHGWNASLYGVMNWVSRVFRDVTIMGKLSEAAQTAVGTTINLFSPLLARIDVFLCRMPIDRRTLFRGIRAPINLGAYAPGMLMFWSALSSTSRDYKVAHEFGNTLFVVHVHNASTIDFLTYFPEEEECLLPSFTWMKAMGAMSPTLLRMLGSTCVYITVQAVGDSPTTGQIIERLQHRKTHTEHLFADFMKGYVEARLYPSPPPIPSDAQTLPMFRYAEDVLLSEAGSHFLLLGPGGTGKTSAALALYCHLVASAKVTTGTQLPVIPVFVPLPGIQRLESDASLLDEALRTALGVETDDMDALLAQTCVVVIFDSLDECNVGVQTLFPLLDKTSYCRRARVVVSSRPEAVAGQYGRALSHTQPCAIQYVQPFTVDDVSTYVTNVLNKSLGASEAVKRLHDLGVRGELLTTPVTLRMGVEILQHELDPLRTPLCVITASCQQHMVVITATDNTRVALYQKYLLSRLSVRGKRVMDTEALLGSELAAEFFHGLWDVSITMLSTGQWSMPLDQVTSRMSKVPGINGVRDLFRHIPMRVESLDDPTADFSFFHKTIVEFLCVQAFWCGDTAQHIRDVSMPNAKHLKAMPFSKREPNVLSLFNECAMSHFQRRMLVCGGSILRTLHSTRGKNRKDEGAAKVIASNALALLCISQYPLQGTDLRDFHIENALLYEANFEGADVRGSHFVDCDMNRASFSYADVDTTKFQGCTFGSLTGPPLKGHSEVVTSVAFSVDSKYIVSGSEDCTVRLWDAVTGVEVKKMEGHSSGVASVAFSVDSKYIVSGSVDRTVRLWDAVTGAEVKKMEGHSNGVTSVAFSVDSKYIVSGSSDSTVRLWDAVTGFHRVYAFTGIDCDSAAAHIETPTVHSCPGPQPFVCPELFVFESEGRLVVRPVVPKCTIIGRAPFVAPFCGTRGTLDPTCSGDRVLRYLFSSA